MTAVDYAVGYHASADVRVIERGRKTYTKVFTANITRRGGRGGLSNRIVGDVEDSSQVCKRTAL